MAKHRLRLNNPPAAPGHNYSLEGLRFVAAFGVICTHVAFQTGVDPGTPIGSVLARFDFFVAVFFALSAFLLWRSYGPGTGRLDSWGGAAQYTRARVGRLVPAYLVVVTGVLLLLPEASGLNLKQVLANLGFAQIYVVGGLIPGLTHLWSLCIEVAFYALFPLLVACFAPLPRWARTLGFLTLAVVSLGWGYLDFVARSPTNTIVNLQIFPPAYTSWFMVGLLAAQYEFRVPAGLEKWLRRRWIWWLVALLIAFIAGQEWFGPLGLEHPEPAEFARRIAAGALFAAAIIAPYALAPGQTILEHPVLTQLGRWSYSIFLVHVAVLALIFPLSGVAYFSGHFLLILVLTTVLSVVLSAIMYQFIEVPGALLVRKPRVFLARAAGVAKPAKSPAG